jgi:hypothetical protein
VAGVESPKLIRVPDLLDANESTWAFVVANRVGREGKLQFRRLEPLGADDRSRSYCGRTADAHAVPSTGGREGAGCSRRGRKCLEGTPHPHCGTALDTNLPPKLLSAHECR